MDSLDTFYGSKTVAQNLILQPVAPFLTAYESNVVQRAASLEHNGRFGDAEYLYSELADHGRCVESRILGMTYRIKMCLLAFKRDNVKDVPESVRNDIRKLQQLLDTQEINLHPVLNAQILLNIADLNLLDEADEDAVEKLDAVIETVQLARLLPFPGSDSATARDALAKLHRAHWLKSEIARKYGRWSSCMESISSCISISAEHNIGCGSYLPMAYVRRAEAYYFYSRETADCKNFLKFAANDVKQAMECHVWESALPSWRQHLVRGLQVWSLCCSSENETHEYVFCLETKRRSYPPSNEWACLGETLATHKCIHDAVVILEEIIEQAAYVDARWICNTYLNLSRAYEKLGDNVKTSDHVLAARKYATTDASRRKCAAREAELGVKEDGSVSVVNEIATLSESEEEKIQRIYALQCADNFWDQIHTHMNRGDFDLAKEGLDNFFRLAEYVNFYDTQLAVAWQMRARLRLHLSDRHGAKKAIAEACKLAQEDGVDEEIVYSIRDLKEIIFRDASL